MILSWKRKILLGDKSQPALMSLLWGGIMKRLLLAVVWAALLVLAAADFGHAADVTTIWGHGDLLGSGLVSLLGLRRKFGN